MDKSRIESELNLLKALKSYNYGLATLDEFREFIDSIGIRGAVKDNGGFIGYDYNNQVWLEFN